MKLIDLISKHKKAFTEQWIEMAWQDYPEQTVRFLRKEKDPFANPVGSAISTGIARLTDLLLENAPWEEIDKTLDELVRVKAVQDFVPSQAIRFSFHPKKIAREIVAKNGNDADCLQDLLEFDQMIDSFVLHAIDLYMKCRETLYEIKATEIRHRTKRVLDRISAADNELIANEEQSDV